MYELPSCLTILYGSFTFSVNAGVMFIEHCKSLGYRDLGSGGVCKEFAGDSGSSLQSVLRLII